MWIMTYSKFYAQGQKNFSTVCIVVIFLIFFFFFFFTFLQTDILGAAVEWLEVASCAAEGFQFESPAARQ